MFINNTNLKIVKKQIQIKFVIHTFINFNWHIYTKKLSYLITIIIKYINYLIEQFFYVYINQQRIANLFFVK